MPLAGGISEMSVRVGWVGNPEGLGRVADVNQRKAAVLSGVRRRPCASMIDSVAIIATERHVPTLITVRDLRDVPRIDGIGWVAQVNDLQISERCGSKFRVP